MTMKFWFMDIQVDDSTVIVFDLDDTLYNELDFLRSAYRYIAQKVEPDNWIHLYSKMFSLYRCNLNAFEYVVNNYDIKLDALKSLYREHQPEIDLFDGVLKIFQNIKFQKGKIAIITDGRSSTQRAKIKSLGIEKYLDFIVISDEFGTEKPNILNFKVIESSLPGESYYYIADNLKKDFIAPNSLGWKTIGVIDNGKNIHFETHCHMNPQNMPHQFVMELKDLNVI